MTLTRRTFVLAGIAAPLAAPFVARAQSWPSGPIRIVVAYPPGGSTDAIMRLVQPGLQHRLGATIVIENRSGASGSVGTAAVVKSPPDGNTWLAVFDNHAANPFVLPGLPYDTEKDLDPVLLIGTAPYVITTAKAKPYQTLADVLAFAKENPGKLTYATPGTGTSLHIGMEQIAARAGIQLTHVPFKGGAETNAAVLGGHTSLQADSTGWKPLVEGGQLRLLAIWTAERSKVWPDTPTLKELGYPFVFDSPFGIAGPKGMDPEVVRKLHDAFKKALEEGAVIETMAKYDMVPRYLDTEGYRKAVEEVIASEQAALEKIGLAKKD